MAMEATDGDVVAGGDGRTPSGDRSTGKRRRRLWSNGEKRALVDLAGQCGASVSEVAAAFGVPASQLYGWRRQIAAGELGGDAAPAFARVEVSEPVPEGQCATGRIVVAFPSGVEVRIDGSVDPTALAVVLAELDR